MNSRLPILLLCAGLLLPAGDTLADYRTHLLQRQRDLYDGTPAALTPLFASEFRERLAHSLARL